MLVATFPAGPLGCNCTIIADPSSLKAIVIDPGGDFEEIKLRLEKHQLSVVSIVHTHTHFDHVGATRQLQDLTGASAHIHEADRFMYQMLGVQTAVFGFETPRSAEVSGDLLDQHSLHCGSIELTILHTPGHSPGSVCFLANDETEQVLLSGDTLFRHGLGRTDLWGGDQNTLVRSIKSKLFTLEDSLLVIPGHGPNTTIGEERERSPIAQWV